MSKIIVIGKGGNLTSVRDEETEKAIQKYCQEKNITAAEFKKLNLSIYTIEFSEDVFPVTYITSSK
jgi:hypothetical protein